MCRVHGHKHIRIRVRHRSFINALTVTFIVATRRFHIALNVFDALTRRFAASNMAATPRILHFVYKVFTSLCNPSIFWSNYPLVTKCKLQATISMIIDLTWTRS